MTIPQTLLDMMRKHGLRLGFDVDTGQPYLQDGTEAVVAEAESLPELMAEAVNVGL